MCNIAAYIGPERAAPLLIEMLDRQEGYDAGFFTGIATIAEGKLHVRKKEGSLKHLLETTDVLDLPGSIGIIHGRTPGSGGDEWSHPFVDCNGETAMVLNGGIGLFTDQESRNRLAAEMVARGHNLRSLTTQPGERHCELPDGRWAHTSDVLCHMIEQHMAEGDEIPEAMARALRRLPKEAVIALLNVNYADRIFFARINKPMMVGRNGRGTFMSTTSLAFPDRGIDWVDSLPANSTAVVTAKGYEVTPMHPVPMRVETNLPWFELEELILKFLSESVEGMTIGGIREATADFWPKDVLSQNMEMFYGIIQRLLKRGRLKVEKRIISGNSEKFTAPQFVMSLV